MIKIVKAEEHHIPDICILWLEFMRYSENIDPIFTPRDGALEVFEKKYLRPVMKDNNSLVLVALDGEKVVGYSYSLINDPSDLEKFRQVGVIHDFFITADYRRRGIGEKIYNEILKWFKSRDIDRIELQVIAKNEAACSFWRKHGYGDFEHTWYRQF